MNVQAHPLEQTRRPVMSRQLLVAIAAVVIVATLLLAAFVVALSRPEAPPEAGTPAAELYGYLAAWEDGDLATAYGYFSITIQREMSRAEFERLSAEYGTYGPQVSRRITFGEARMSGDRATQPLVIDEFYGNAFGSSTYQYEIRVPMVREEGVWYIDIALIGIQPGPRVEPLGG